MGCTTLLINLHHGFRNMKNQCPERFTKAKDRCTKELRGLKDQMLFVIFQLFFYIIDIGSDAYQAVTFWRYVFRKHFLCYSKGILIHPCPYRMVL